VWDKLLKSGMFDGGSRNGGGIFSIAAFFVLILGAGGGTGNGNRNV